jgi:hypothetical protein
MWQQFAQRAAKSTRFDEVAREALWLFNQLKPSVLNEEWLQAQPNGVDTFIAKCKSCSEKTQVSSPSPSPPPGTPTHPAARHHLVAPDRGIPHTA